MHLKSKFYLIDDDSNKYMGVGVLWLLQKVEETGSLRKASKALNISYSKSYNMICNLEKNLNKEILVREKGGANHKGSYLTPFAIEFCNLYKEFQEKAKKIVEKPYNEFEDKLNLLLNKECNYDVKN